MTISLLRRIWQRIHVESAAAPPKQRLTGFEPLEPRMVLSGFFAYSTPDYFLPAPGVSYVDHGAEISRPMSTVGDYTGDNSLSRSFAQAAPQYQFSPNETLVVYNLNTPGDRLIASREYDIWFGSGWNSGSGSFGGASSLDGLVPSSLAADAAESESEFESGAGEEMASTPTLALNSPTIVSGFPLVNSIAIDRILSDRSSIFGGLQTGIPLPPQMISMPMNGSLEMRDLGQFSMSADRRFERDPDHDVPVAPHAAGADASLALTVRTSSSSLDRGMVSSTAAALAGQAGAAGDSIGVQTADGSTVTAKVGSQTSESSIRQQASLTELTEAERLNLKRKLAAGVATLEEAARANNGRGEQFDESDAQLAYDAARPFDVTAIPNGQLRQGPAASLADDGLIEVLAADVTAVIASGDAVNQTAANRQIAMEPAVATYQAFETIVDAGSGADIAGDAARLAAAVAMNGQPVVQAE